MSQPLLAFNEVDVFYGPIRGPEAGLSHRQRGGRRWR